MKPFIHALIILMQTTPFLISAQITIKGDLRLGDTSQVHVLHTVDGSKLVGRIIAFDPDQVTFLFNRENLIQFKLADINSVEVVPADGGHGFIKEKSEFTISTGIPFVYSLTDKRGNEFHGRLKSITEKGIEVENDGPSDLLLQFKDLNSINLKSPPFYKSNEPPVELHYLVTKRGDQFYGQVIGFDGSVIRFTMTNRSELQFYPAQISSLQLVQYFGGSASTETNPDVHSSHSFYPDKLFFSPTGFNLKSKQGEFRNVLIFYNTFDYALNDNLTLGAGASTILISSMLSARIKLGIELTNKVHIAAGGQIGASLGVDNRNRGAGLVYGMVSAGSHHNFINFGVGKGMTFDEGTNFTGFTLGGTFSVSKAWKMFGEYVRVFENDNDRSQGFFFGGSRWMKGKHRIDFGFGIFSVFFEENSTVPFPIASYAYRLN